MPTGLAAPIADGPLLASAYFSEKPTDLGFQKVTDSLQV